MEIARNNLNTSPYSLQHCDNLLKLFIDKKIRKNIELPVNSNFSNKSMLIYETLFKYIASKFNFKNIHLSFDGTSINGKRYFALVIHFIRKETKISEEKEKEKEIEIEKEKEKEIEKEKEKENEIEKEKIYAIENKKRKKET
ncbi:hypothetical protein M0812_01547 [Anaeramoeba flamelloides]|uniref:Uncharacterized protein n=1 Tax=Anaeramoeba flamelloides TaxID=1746091 RepID=A0AAV7ZM76_9EUKA|nr:hypothetical protein M0812_01547 [Anaeramoeba flamelloides]